MTEFKETQRFTQWWLWVILLGSWAAMLYAFWIEANFDVISLISFSVFALGLPILFWQMRLMTRITEDGVFVRFIPFHFKEQFYSWESIESAQVRTYSPLNEYGGWGIKYGFNGQGKVYNVAGDQGLQLVFKSGEKLLIGTQKGTEIQAFVRV